jgi:hypothetical protein
MGIVNEIKDGADLAKPRLSVGWIIGGIVAAFLLIGVILLALWGWGKVSNTVGTSVPVASSALAPVRIYAQ